MFLLSIIFVAGCSKTSNSDQDSTTTVTNQNAAGIQAMRQTPDIFGQVKEVNGSDISIALAQMPQRNQSQNGQQQNHQNPPQNQGNNNQGVNRPPGDAALQLTGETKTINVPDGVKLYSGGGGPRNQGNAQNQTAQEIALQDLKAGDVISVYYKSGTTTVDRIVVRAVTPQQ